MPEVVVLNGPAGVGKTTVGRRLAAGVRNGVCVHGDDLRRFVVARDPRTVVAGPSYVAGAALADVYLDAGYDRVVFEYVFPAARHVERFRRALRSRAPVHVLTLWAPLAIVAAREAARPGRERLGGRVAACWHELAAGLPGLGAVVDASGPVESVVAEIERRLSAAARADRAA
jgi:thymidylate kinase